MGVDEKLLDINREAEEKAGDLQAAKREMSLGATPEESAGLSLREQVQVSRQEELRANKKQEKNKSLETNPVRLATDSLLKGAWKNLITSWGLTLLYIDLHVILNKVFGDKFFGPLGEEWTPAKIRHLSGSEIKKTAGCLKAGETPGCAILNLLVLAIIIGLLALVSLIYSVISDPVGTFWKILSDWVSKNLSSFAAIFK
ncbi:MAG: hypothetical protein JST_000116 [Candidatus Parcubacteria bacterium]|jgi:hypothetical protein|nr:MAG: hypothetical protein JST_1000 [Candidatus Parcubacteria bacterium]